MDKRIREDILYRFKLCRNKNIFYLRDRSIPYRITEWLFVVKMIFRKLLIDDWEEDERKGGRNEWFDREIVFRVKFAETTKKKKRRKQGSMYGYRCPRYISRDFEIDRVRNTSRAIQKFHVCSSGRQCASFSPDRVREIEQNCWNQWSSFV